MTHDDARPEDAQPTDATASEPPVPPASERPAMPAPYPPEVPPAETAWPVAPAWPDTAVIEQPPTLVTDATTTRLGEQPTTVDPLVPPTPPPPVPAPPVAPPAVVAPAPPVLPVAPSWIAPTVPGAETAPGWGAPAAPAYGATPPGAAPGQYGAPQYGAPQYGAPQYGAAGQYGVPPGGMPGVSGWGAVPLAPKPGVIPLRPLSVGEILDAAVTYIRRDPKTVLGISAIVAVVLALLQFGFSSSLGSLFSTSFDPTTGAPTASNAELIAGFTGLVGGVVLLYAVTFLLTTAATGMLTTVMGRAVLGQRVTAREAWQRVAGRIWPLLGLTLLTGLIISATFSIGIALAVLVGVGLAAANLTGLGVFLGIVLGIAATLATVWLSIRLLLAPVALILEGVGITRALRRSMTLVSGAWWRTFGIYLLASFLAGIVGQVLTIPFAILGAILGGLTASSSSSPFGIWSALASSLGTLVSSAVVLPFTSGIVALLYVDRRIRREALDIELARAVGIRV